MTNKIYKIEGTDNFSKFHEELAKIYHSTKDFMSVSFHESMYKSSADAMVYFVAVFTSYEVHDQIEKEWAKF